MNASTKKAPATINPKGDAAIANDAGAAQRIEVLQAIETADGLLGGALLEALKVTVTSGPTSKEEVSKHWASCNNPAVYSSWFNVGAKAQAVVGQKLALQLIEDAAKLKGQAFQNARDALQSVIRDAKAQGVKELKPAAARMAAKSAVAKVSAPKVKAPTLDKATRGPKMQDAATLAAAAIEAGKGHRELAAFVLLAAQHASRLPAPEGRDGAHHEAVAALQDAAEKWGVFRK